MNGRKYSFQNEKTLIPFSELKQFSINNNRVQILEGGYIVDGALMVINVKVKALTTLSNSPGILNPSTALLCDAALSCIDISSGIATAVDNSIPCGANKTYGTVYIQSITTDHIYAISGVAVLA